MQVVITSATELTSAQLEKIEKAVTKKYGKNVQFRTAVNPSLIGGLTITLGSRQLDGSLKYKLSLLQKAVDENQNAI